MYKKVLMEIGLGPSMRKGIRMKEEKMIMMKQRTIFFIIFFFIFYLGANLHFPLAPTTHKKIKKMHIIVHQGRKILISLKGFRMRNDQIL
jgi:hypothetical protein